MLEVLHTRRRAYSDFGVYQDPDHGHVSTSPSVENVDQLGVEGPAGSGGKRTLSRSPSPSPSSRSRSRDRRPSSSTSHATGHLAAHAFNLMVTVPQSLSNDDQMTPPTMGKLTPDLLLGNHYEADISDQSDGCLGVPQGFLDDTPCQEYARAAAVFKATPPSCHDEKGAEGEVEDGFA